MSEQIAKPPPDHERPASQQSLMKLHRGNRFRLMFGLPLLEEPKKVAMKPSVKPPPQFWQPSLLDIVPDKPIARNGEARARYGRVVEEVVQRLLRLTDIPNSGTYDIVFDAYGHDTYVEIKSLRSKNGLPIYEWRRTKDRECGKPLVYAIGMHDCPSMDRLEDVYRGMARTLTKILILPSWAVDLAASRERLRQLVPQGPAGERMGYRRKGYCEGYRNVPSGFLESLSFHPPVIARGILMGIALGAQVHFHRSITPWVL